MSENDNDAAWERMELTYLGRRWSDGKRAVRHVFDDGTPECVLFAGKIMPAPVVGGVYSVERRGHSFRVGAAEYVRDSDSDELAAWRLADRAALTQQERYRAAKRLNGENGDFGGLTLAELRDTMQGQLPHVRAGTLAAVITWLGS